MNMKINLLIIGLIFANISCGSTEDKLQCLADLNRTWQKQQNYKSLQSALKSQVNEWVNDSIKDVQYLRKKIWKIDETVYFNSSENAAILLLLQQDTSQNAKMDFIQLIYAKLFGDRWHFYLKSMPTLN